MNNDITIFLDLDNTVAANETCENIEFYKGLYLNKKPIQIVIDAVEHLYGNQNIIIMSRYVGGDEGKQEKIDWMRKYLPECMLKNPPFLIDASDKKTKADYIIAYAFLKMLTPDQCIIIDDNKLTLQQCNSYNITTLYPQQVICNYEEVKVNVKTK